MHETLKKFGYPNTLLREFIHWCVLLRPTQATLGALVLVSKHEATSMATLPPDAFAEMHDCATAIDTALNNFRPFDKLNYLALMMVDPQVHFHVLPRYAKQQEFDGVAFTDPAWPGPPDLKAVNPVPESTQKLLHSTLLDAFAKVV
jgi:diadenosine tetraphosphate (Ap4A) HIT family hydrolase